MARMGSALLVVTDDTALARDVASWVIGVGRVRHVADARTARAVIDRERPRLVLVDLLLADFEGARLLADLRYRRGVRAFGVSSAGGPADAGPRLLLGGTSSSWLTAPLDGPELRRQLRAASVTPAEALSGWVQLGGLELDLDRRLLLTPGRTLSLGLREFAILVQLASQPGRVLTRQDLLERAFQGQAATESAVNVRIRSLRHKLATVPPLDEQLVTVYGVGYRWDAVAMPAVDVRTTRAVRAG
jgi:DNA-binding response OmpR family regulator